MRASNTRRQGNRTSGSSERMQRVRSGPISITFGIILRAGERFRGANLFIYTLPSSPIGEAAIHFGFLGPVLYAAGDGSALSAVLDMANEMVLAGEAPVMLAGKAEADEAMFFVLRRERGQEGSVLCDVAEARALVETGSACRGAGTEILTIGGKKGIV